MPYLHIQLKHLTCFQDVINFKDYLLEHPSLQFFVVRKVFMGQQSNDGKLVSDICLEIRQSNHISSLTLENFTLAYLSDTEFKKVKYRVPHSKILPRNNLQLITNFSYPSLTPITDSSYINRSMQRLIYYLSAKGRGTKKSFNSVCEILGLTSNINDTEIRNRLNTIYRNLALLDILEQDFYKNRWSIRPSRLISLSQLIPSNEFYITGAQSIGLYDRIRNITQGSITAYLQVTDFAPSRITLKIENNNQIENLSSVVNLNTELRQNIDSLIPIDQWRDSLPVIGGLVVTQYQWKIFRATPEKFEGCSLPRMTGFYEMCNERISQRWNSIFYNAALESFIQSDWYGMRFLHLYHYNQLNECVFNIHSNTLAILSNQRWPMIYEKALVKFSGLIPIQREINNKKWLLYANIPEDVAQRLTTLLQLDYRPIS